MPKLLAAALAALLLVPATAAASAAAGTGASLPPVVKTLTVPTASHASCLTTGAAAGRASTAYRAPMSGYLTVRLAAARGDWDLAVLQNGRGAGASQGFGAREVVQTWVQAGDALTVQGCRRSGRARQARVSMTLLDAKPPAAGDRPRLLRVSLGSQKRLEQLERLGVDVTHNQSRGSADVVVAGADQLRALDRAGFKHRTLIDDLNAQYLRSRRADAAFAARNARSALPSGRETYRAYEDYGRELKELADRYPRLVKPVSIGRSYQGRELSGVEIARNVRNGEARPVYLVVALHHAREWPSAEAAMEFAHLLVNERDTNPRVQHLLETTRTVIVPLINPDGFITSQRAAPVDPASNLSDRGINPAIPVFGSLTTAEGVAPPGGILSYRRKNCAGDIPSPLVPCELQWGIDPNRNYGQGWGGPGSSAEAFSQSYHGPGPWSEPETQAVHQFSARHQVTTIITMHNVAALVLRPPGVHDAGNAPDEPRLKEIGDAMADAAGYTSQFGFQLYDTSGTTEDWNYAAQGAYGFTIELGPKDGEFHMPYEVGFVDQWTGDYAGNGKGLREALLIAGEAAANPADHAVIVGSAPKGAKLRLRKAISTQTSEFCRRAIGAAPFNVEPVCIDGPHPAMKVDETLDTAVTLNKSGPFELHANPSTRPFVGGRASIQTAAQPLRTQELTRKETTTPNPGLPVELGDSAEDQSFQVAAADEIAKLRVLVEMGAEDDYDIELYYNRRGTLELVDSSANGAGDAEEIVVTYPEPGEYVLRVINYTASGDWKATIEQFPGQFVLQDTGVREAWTLTCEIGGQSVASRSLVIGRGERADVRSFCKGRAKRR
ncbi:MAG TPA: M14 family zinc carboxypeptidase [Solirubrobacteraceae bacterium]|jgi:hypothetical protein|nr:M14 family zinc carboxypeptidase [Solirubrobacteraceae bacterium]